MITNNPVLERLSNSLIVVTRKGGVAMTKIILDNGMTIEGTPEQIRHTLEKIGFSGDSKYYWSESKKEYLLIEDMNTTHLRNAILRIYKDWLDNLYKITDPKSFIKEVSNPSLESNKTFIALAREMLNRGY